MPAVPCTVATSSHSHSAARPARSMREQVSRLVVGCGTAVVLGCLGCELELAVCLAPAHAICAQVHVLRGPSTALGRGAQVRSGEAKWLVVASATLFDLLFFLLLAFSLLFAFLLLFVVRLLGCRLLRLAVSMTQITAELFVKATSSTDRSQNNQLQRWTLQLPPLHRSRSRSTSGSGG